MVYDVENGFHKGTLISCIALSLVWSMFSSIILPNTPFLIRFYMPDVDPTQIGTLTGVFTAAFFLGCVPGAVIWGGIADTIGRKTTMMITILLNAVFIIALGFSTNFWFTVAIRFLNGLIDGTIPISKTMLSEISNSRNISLGTSFFFVGCSFGGLLGPVLFAYLSNPDHISGLIRLFPVLKERPFMLPILIMSVLFLLCAVCFLFSIETLTEEEKKKSKEMRARLKASYSGILRKNSSQRDMNEKFLLTYNNESSPRQLFKQYDFLHIMATYGCFALIQLGFDTILPVALSSPRSLGGLELKSDEISYLVGTSSIFQLAMVLITPLASKLISYRTQYILYCCLFHVCILLAPIVFLCKYLDGIPFFLILLLYHVFLVLLRSLSFNISIVLFANLSYKEVRATVMGIGQTIAGVCRVLGPLIFPPLYSWSCPQHSWIINSNFCFYVLGICGFITMLLMIGVSKGTDNSKGSLYSIEH